MIRYDAFRALKSDVGYPLTLFNVSLSDVAFDLPLPPPICDAIMDVLIRSGNFERVEKLCTPPGLDKIRTAPKVLRTANLSPAYAGCDVLEDISGPDLVIGYVLYMIAANESAAREVLRLAVEGGTFQKEVDVWIINHTAHFSYCGGFEIARMFCYSDIDEKANVNGFIERFKFNEKPNPLAKIPGRKLRFRDMVNA